ncbi:MAG: hydroxymethylbilane synthase, partial [Pacificimonas sp.]
IVGTSSPRRAAQLRRRVPGLEITAFRGNVATRLKRLEDREADATILAAAGLDRLGVDVGTPVATEDMLPAPGQGAIGVEVRSDNLALRQRLATISDADSYVAVRAERAFARTLGGSCHSPVAALAEALGEDRFRLRVEILTPDGGIARSDVVDFAKQDAVVAGDRLGRRLLSEAEPELAAIFDGAA